MWRGRDWKRGRPSPHRGTRGSTHNHARAKSVEIIVENNPGPPLGALIKALTREDIKKSGNGSTAFLDEKPEIKNSEIIGSYSWLNEDKPTILVPGMPPAWTPLCDPPQLSQDAGDYYRDTNAAHFPSYPMEPSVRAILLEHGDFEFQRIDIFACSSTMGSLLRFVRGVDMPFRFFVEVLGNTAFFVRHENSPDELISNVKGYGHTFPEANTTWKQEVKGSISNQRLLKYSFAGLECILRFECDGYIEHEAPNLKTESLASSRTDDTTDDDIAHMLESASVGGSQMKQLKPEGPLQIKTAGSMVPQAAVFNLKTRNGWRPHFNTFDSVLESELPRCWATQISHFILGRYTKPGIFDDIKVRPISDHVLDWERKNQSDLGCLSWLLRQIIAEAKGRGDKKLEVCWKTMETIELREHDSQDHNVLPAELKSRCMEDMPNKLTSEKPGSKSDSGKPSMAFVFDENPTDYTACSADSCGYCGRCSY